MAARTDRAKSLAAAASPPRALVRVRPLQPGDVVGLATLRRQVEETHARLLPDYFQVAGGARVPGTDGAWSMTWVANLGPWILGYIAAKIVETPSDPMMIPCRRLQIVEIGVDLSARRSGVGRRLMAVATEWGRRQGAREAVLTVWSENRAALGLYHQLGFQPIATVMRRSLGETEDPPAAELAGAASSGRGRGGLGRGRSTVRASRAARRG